MDDLEAAHRHYLDAVDKAVTTGDWQPYLDLLTDDAVYRRTGMPDRIGRDQIAEQMHRDTSRLPGSLIVRIHLHWVSLDHRHGRVVQEMSHVARDPGDGSLHQAAATSTLHHAGGGRWDSVEVVHSPEAYRTMYRGWIRAAVACGNQADADELAASLRAEGLG